MIVYKEKLLRKSSNQKSKLNLSTLVSGHYMAFKHSISFATYLAANFGCNRFRIMPDIVSKILRAAIWSCCAVRFESEQTPFPRTGRISFATDLAANFGCNRFRIMPDIISKILRAAIWSRCAVRFESEQTPFPLAGRRLRSAALHRIWFGTCCFVPMSYFYSETNEWLQDWAKRQALLWSALTRQQLLADSIKIFISHEKKSDSLRPDIYKALKPFWLSNWVSIARVVAHFPQASWSRPAATAAAD